MCLTVSGLRQRLINMDVVLCGWLRGLAEGSRMQFSVDNIIMETYLARPGP